MAVVNARAAAAEIAVLVNGTTLKLSTHRVAGETAWLVLKDGGELAVPLSDVREFVADEVPDEAPASPEAVALASGSGGIEALAGAAARRHGLDPALVRAVVSVESAFRPRAVSHKGAQGLMQLMPATARAMGVRDAFDPASNLDGGSRYLRVLLERYRGDLTKALAAYNAGEGAVDRYGGVPPYRETRDYVKKVLGRYQANRVRHPAPAAG